MTRYIHTQVPTPSNSVARKRKPAYIPPFSFVGQLQAGSSHYYQPTNNIMITGGSVTSLGDGILDVSISVFKKEPFVDQPIIVGGTVLGAEDKKILFSMEALVTPYDHIFVGAWETSRHSNVSIQLVGVEL